MGVITIALLLSVLIAHSELASANEYCNLESCNTRQKQHPLKPHPVCTYGKQLLLGKSCPRNTEVGLTQDEVHTIVNLHNKLRRKVADGYENPQPAAKYMPNLEWDFELAYIAQIWANQCIDDHSCSDTPTRLVGQNLGWQEFKNHKDRPTVEKRVQSWYDEVKRYNKDYVTLPFGYLSYSQKKALGHYTQMVWAKTTKIGCGAVRYIDQRKYDRLFLVCNYYPTGNVFTETIYEPKYKNAQPFNYNSYSVS